MKMQNEQSLIDAGFVLADNVYTYKGNHQTFIAKVIDEHPAYVQLFIKRGRIDLRPESSNYGKCYISPVKDCCSNGSVVRAVSKYDVPTERMQFQIGGIYINS